MARHKRESTEPRKPHAQARRTAIEPNRGRVDRRPTSDAARHLRLRPDDSVGHRAVRCAAPRRCALLDRLRRFHRSGGSDLARQPLAAVQAARAFRLVRPSGAKADDAGHRERALHRAAERAGDRAVAASRRAGAGPRRDRGRGADQRDLCALRDACLRDRVPDPRTRIRPDARGTARAAALAGRTGGAEGADRPALPVQQPEHARPPDRSRRAARARVLRPAGRGLPLRARQPRPRPGAAGRRTRFRARLPPFAGAALRRGGAVGHRRIAPRRSGSRPGAAARVADLARERSEAQPDRSGPALDRAHAARRRHAARQQRRAPAQQRLAVLGPGLAQPRRALPAARRPRARCAAQRHALRRSVAVGHRRGGGRAAA